MDEQPAPEEGAELALDEAGQPHPVGAQIADMKGLFREGLQNAPLPRRSPSFRPLRNKLTPCASR